MQSVRFMLRWIRSGCVVAALAALPLAGGAAAQKSDWPSAANTGVPAGITLTTVTSTTRLPAGVTINRHGDLIVDAPRVVLSGLDIRGSVYINASNVTLINSKVTAGGNYVIKIATGVTGTLIQNSTISGTAASPEGSKGIAGSGTFIANNISNMEDGIFLLGDKDTLIQGNYIHDLKATGSPHYDGIQIEGSVSNVIIRHNTVINDYGQTSALMIDNYFGPISNITVDNNLLVGGGYTIYVDGQFSGGPITGVSITNNHMGRGHWGITNFNKTSPVYTGNVDDGASIAAGLPTTGQPPAPSESTPPPASAGGRRGLRHHQRRLHRRLKRCCLGRPARRWDRRRFHQPRVQRPRCRQRAEPCGRRPQSRHH